MPPRDGAGPTLVAPPPPASVIIDTNALLHDAAYDYYDKEYKTELKQYRIQRRAAVSIKSTQRNETATGDEIIQKVRYLLETGFGIKRSEIQVKIHKAFLEACLPKVYQGAWDENKPRILREFMLKKLMQEVLVVMPRRRGKTYATAMMAAALILTVPDCSVAVFSTGERTARMLMNVVRDMIEKAFQHGAVLREDFQIDTDNKEQIVFIGPDGSKRVLGCYPGSVRGDAFKMQCAACDGDVITSLCLDCTARVVRTYVFSSASSSKSAESAKMAQNVGHRCLHTHYVPEKSRDFVDHVDSRPSSRNPLYVDPSQTLTLKVVSVAVGDELSFEVHPTQIQTFHILAGEASIAIGPVDAPRWYHELAPGHVVVVPAQTGHIIKNSGRSVLKLLTTYTEVRSDQSSD